MSVFISECLRINHDLYFAKGTKGLETKAPFEEFPKGALDDLIEPARLLGPAAVRTTNDIVNIEGRSTDSHLSIAVRIQTHIHQQDIDPLGDLVPRRPGDIPVLHNRGISLGCHGANKFWKFLFHHFGKFIELLRRKVAKCEGIDGLKTFLAATEIARCRTGSARKMGQLFAQYVTQ